MALNKDLFIPGREFSEVNYEGFFDWLIQFTSTDHIWKYQPTYLIVHFLFIFGGLATLTHAFIQGGRLPYLWLATFLHGFVVESLSYFLPDVDNFWHSQSPIMFLGRRLPIHILFLYPCFIYHAFVAVAKMKLPKWAEAFAVGLVTVMVDFPYDIISVNFLHWTWHDTDPNIEDRFYWVPWNSFYFHCCFAASLTFWFRYSRKLICGNNEMTQADKPWKELLCTLIAALLGTPGGILMFLPLYHPLHDIYKIHSEVTFFILFAIVLLIIWSGDRTARIGEKRRVKFHWSTWILLTHLFVHYGYFTTMSLYFKPENEISIGLKEPIGPCDEYVPIQTAFGMTLNKRKYLCPTDYDEQYFDWKCLPDGKPPSYGSTWYTACGVPAPNMFELTCISIIIFVVAAVVFGQLHLNSFGDDVLNIVKKSTQKKKMK